MVKMSEEYTHNPPLNVQKKERAYLARKKISVAIQDVVAGADPSEVAKRFPPDPRLEKSENDQTLIAEAQMYMDDIKHANHPHTRAQAIQRFNKFMEETEKQRKNLHYGINDAEWKKKLRDAK
jgi:hypothetical protein